MADVELVELVIKIPKTDYRCIKEIPLSSMFGFDNWKLIAQAIANGTPLPKGHGRLIDADDLLEHYDNTEYFNGIEMRKIHFVQIGYINDSPTIIEADKESEG